MRWVPQPFAICYDICHPVGRALSPHGIPYLHTIPRALHQTRPPTRHVICYGLHPPRYLARDLARYADLLAGSSMLSSWVVWEEPPCRDAKTLPSPRTGSLHVHLYCLIFTILLCTVCTGAGRVVDVVAGSGKARCKVLGMYFRSLLRSVATSILSSTWPGLLAECRRAPSDIATRCLSPESPVLWARPSNLRLHQATHAVRSLSKEDPQAPRPIGPPKPSFQQTSQ